MTCFSLSGSSSPDFSKADCEHFDFGIQADVIVRVRGEFPSNNMANNVVVRIPLPKGTQRVSCEQEPGAVGQSTDFKEATKLVEWTVKKVGWSPSWLQTELL